MYFIEKTRRIYKSMRNVPSVCITILIFRYFFRHRPITTFPQTGDLAASVSQFCRGRRVRAGRRQGYQESRWSYTVVQLPFPICHQVIILSRKVRIGELNCTLVISVNGGYHSLFISYIKFLFI